MKCRKFKTVHENMSFLEFKSPWKRFLQHIYIFDAFCGTNIYLTKRSLKIKPFRSTVSLLEIVLCTQFVWASIFTYLYNGTAKVPISAEIGVRVKVSSS